MGRWPETGATAFYTSGSVGASRAVPLKDANLAAAALAFAARGEIRAGDVAAIGVPPAHVFGFVRGVLNALLVGAEAVFFSPRRDALAEAAALGASVALLPAAALGPAARNRSSSPLRAVFCGGGRVREEDAARIESVRGVPVRSGYGLTESAGLGARQRVDRPRRAGSSGPPPPGLDLDVCAEDGEALPPGEAGEIRLRGAAILEGYLSPDDPPPFDASGRLRTGDVGMLDADGELHVRGRLAYSLSSSGRVLCAEEVEAAIEEHPGVIHAAAAPVGRAFAVLVVASDPSPASLDEILRHAELRLPAYARPRRLVPVAEIPRTAGGKIDRSEAARRLASAGRGAAS
jgi:acyl-CoA synthetase (AMP-forming)/AMP-acid ligase II